MDLAGFGALALPQGARHDQHAGILHLVGAEAQGQQPFVGPDVIPRGVKGPPGHLVQVRLFGLVVRKVHIGIEREIVGVGGAGRQGVDRHHLVQRAAVQRIQPDHRVPGIIIGVLVVLQAGKPLALPHAHVVAVDDQVAAMLHIALVIHVGDAQDVVFAVQAVAQVELVVVPLQYREVHRRVLDADPAHHVGVLCQQRAEIHLRQRRGRGVRAVRGRGRCRRGGALALQPAFFHAARQQQQPARQAGRSQAHGERPEKQKETLHSGTSTK